MTGITLREKVVIDSEEEIQEESMSEKDLDILYNLFEVYDLSLGEKENKEWYLHDSQGLFSSPSFPAVLELYKWVVLHSNEIEEHFKL